MAVQSLSVRCMACGVTVEGESGRTLVNGTRPTCASCGGAGFHIHIGIVEDQVGPIHDQVRGKLKQQGIKKPRVEFVSGDDLQRSTGRWLRKQRRIDREQDRYEEVVVDPDTGAIVHECREPLSDHIGHGSAKP